jgi:hypothetical protein
MEQAVDITIVARASHQRACAEALASGIRHHGGTARIQESSECKTKHVACWGWRRGKVLRALGHEVLVMERAYLGDRYEWYSLGWNGLNGYADFRYVREDGGERFRKHFTMKPWRKTPGKYVLLIGQVPGDMSLKGRDIAPWYVTAAVTAQAMYRMPVLFREHPQNLARGLRRSPGYTEMSKAVHLEDALADAHVVITYNSNTGVDAAIAGVPVVAVDPGSMASAVAASRVGDRIMPAREPWAHALAWKQWTLREIAQGVPFDT